MSKPTVVDIPSEPRKLTFVKMKPISITMDSPKNEYSKPNPELTLPKAFTLDDFKKCAKQAEEANERKRTQDRERANDLSDLRSLLNLPPEPGLPLSHF